MRLAFLSYRTKRWAEAAPLVEALRSAGVDVWRDEERLDEGASIQRGVLEGLAQSHVLLAWYSANYAESRMCQWEQALAHVASPERVFLLLPPDVEGLDHVLGLTKDRRAWRVPAADDPELARFASRLAAAIQALEARPLGELAPLAQPPAWVLRAEMHPSERFTGRAKDLWALHTGLHADRLVAVTGRSGPNTAQVRGIGGIGKTLLAVEYAARFGSAFPGGVFWIDVAERTPESAFTDAAIALGFAPDARAAAKQALLERGSYLWVVDNLGSGRTQAEVEAWCAPTPNGRTLVTTRSRTWASLGRALDLDVLEPDEAFALLTKRRAPRGVEEEAAAHELCTKLGRHPLALDVLGALVQRHPSPTPYAAWKARLEQGYADALALGEAMKEELPTGCARNVATVLRTSIDGLEREALDLLCLAAVLGDAPIPAELAMRAWARVDPAPVRTTEDAWTIGVEAGHARSLIETKEGVTPAYAVHALVRRVFRYDASERTRLDAFREAALRVVLTFFDDVEDIRKHAPMIPVVAHAEHLAEPMDHPIQTAISARVAYFQQVRGNYRAARVGSERVLEARTRLLGAYHPDTLAAEQNLAGVLYAQGEFAGARHHAERALEMMTRLLGAEHPDTLAVKQNLAGMLHAQGDLAGAHRHLEVALEARTRLLGAEHPNTLTTLRNLAMTLSAQGDLSGARRHEERVLEALTRLLGPEHPDTLATEQNLAVTLKAQGDLADARRLYERVLEARTRLLGAEHPNTNGTRYNLVLTLLELDAPAAAEHFAVLERLELRPTDSLSADERQILAKLPGLRARIAGHRGPK